MTLFTLSPDFVRGLSCAVWLAVLIAMFLRRLDWRTAPGGVRLILAGLAIIGAGLLISSIYNVLHHVAVSPDRMAAEAISLIAGLFVLAGVLRFNPVIAPPAPHAAAPDIPAEPEGGAAGEPRSETQEAMSLLAGGLAHDFSNVLTVILSGSEILLMEQDTPEKMRRRIERIHGAAERGAALTDQLRAFAGRQDLLSQPVDMHELLRAAAVDFKSTLGPKIELHYNLTEEHCLVLIDPTQMTASVATVLAYCRAALPEGGRVDLSTRLQEFRGAPGMVLTIARSGERLSMEQARRLLTEPYSIGGTSVVGGGFGLSLVSGFIRQSGGEARFVDEPGRGPVLEILLPLALHEAVVANDMADRPR